MRYLGPIFPVTRALKRGDPHDDVLGDLASVRNELVGHLLDKFDQERAKILADRDLSDSGKKKRLRQLADAIESSENLQVANARVQAGKERAAELTKLLSALPERPPATDVYACIEHVMKKRDAIGQFRALPSEQRFQTVASAIDKAPSSPQAREWLSWLVADDLLDEQAAARAKAAIMRGAQPGVFDALAELEGTMDYAGTRDPMTSALAVAEFTVEKLHEHLHADLDTLPADVLKDASIGADGGAIALTREQAKDAKLFEAARSVAAERGLDLRVEQTSVPTDAPSSNGTGGAS